MFMFYVASKRRCKERPTKINVFFFQLGNLVGKMIETKLNKEPFFFVSLQRDTSIDFTFSGFHFETVCWRRFFSLSLSLSIFFYRRFGPFSQIDLIPVQSFYAAKNERWRAQDR